MFAGLKQNHKVTRERISESALNFVIEKISDFKLSTKLSATMIYRYQIILNGHYRTGNNNVIEKISDFKLSTKPSATIIYHYQMDITEQATTKNCPEFLFDKNILA